MSFEVEIPILLAARPPRRGPRWGPIFGSISGSILVPVVALAGPAARASQEIVFIYFSRRSARLGRASARLGPAAEAGPGELN